MNYLAKERYKNFINNRLSLMRDDQRRDYFVAFLEAFDIKCNKCGFVFDCYDNIYCEKCSDVKE